jgi:hypothetical protein
MVSVSAVSSAQNTPLRTFVQGSAPAPAPPPPLSSIDFVVSGIYVNNLQNVAILEYRSSQTDQVIQQYPDQAQINAFKAAQRLAEQASLQPADVHQTAAPQTQDTQQTQSADTEAHVSVPATGDSDAPVSGPESSSGSAGSSSGTTTSVVA